MSRFFRQPLTLSLFIAASIPLSAQVYTPPSGGGSSGGSSEPIQDTVTRSNSSQTQAGQNDSVFGNELPFIDPSSEMLTWNGKRMSLTDTRILAARFERYLNEPEASSQAAAEYREVIEKILSLVSPHHPGGPDFTAAVKLLPRASSFPGDAKLCDSLSQAIYAAVLARKDVGKTRDINEAMEEEKRRLIGDTDWKVSQSRDHSLNETTPVGGNRREGRRGDAKKPGKAGAPAQDEGRGMQSLEYKEALRRIAEIEALKKSNTTKNELQLLQAKAQYQALLIQFFIQRRFEHVIMGARFYHQIFGDGDNRLRVKKNSDVTKFISDTFGVSPTVATLDSLATETRHDVDQGVQAFIFLSDQKELETAAKRLVESYYVGEFMPSVQTLPRERKRTILEFVRNSKKLLTSIEVKDYEKAEEILNVLVESAVDFDTTKAEAAIATFTRVSNMHIDAAKLAASKSNTDTAAEEIQKAMEAWPKNPRLAEFDQLVAQGSDLSQASNDFDRLLSENNYRAIYMRQYEFATAIKGDTEREEAFKQIIRNLFRIDGAIEKAQEFSKMGQSYAAWEQLNLLRDEFPDDPKLGRELELLAPQVADFTKALDTANDFVKRRDPQIGSALSWYLQARSIYPSSEIAQKGIDELSNKILQNSAEN